MHSDRPAIKFTALRVSPDRVGSLRGASAFSPYNGSKAILCGLRLMNAKGIVMLSARLLLLTALLAGSSLASEAEPDVAHLRKCTEEPNDAKRLACYDVEMGRSKRAAGDFGTESLPRKQSPQPAASDQAAGDFGTESLPRKQSPQPAASVPNDLITKVQAIGQGAYGKIVVTLDNGQVWEQQEMLDFSLNVGDVVTIKHGLLGSFWMINPSHVSTRVRRTK
jgi:hypothetical protein